MTLVSRPQPVIIAGASSKSPAEKTDLATLASDPNIIKKTISGITFYIPRQLTVDKPTFQMIIDRITLMNNLLPNDKKATKVLLSDKVSSAMQEELILGEGRYTLLRVNIKDVDISNTINHEMGHFLYKGLIEDNAVLSEEWDKLYIRVMLAGSYGLFDESNYDLNMPSDYGHPFSSPSEMFASSFALYNGRTSLLDARTNGDPVAREAYDFIVKVFGRGQEAVSATAPLDYDSAFDKFMVKAHSNEEYISGLFTFDPYIKEGERRKVLNYLGAVVDSGSPYYCERLGLMFEKLEVSDRLKAMLVQLTFKIGHEALKKAHKDGSIVIATDTFAGAIRDIKPENIVSIYSKYLDDPDDNVKKIFISAATIDDPKFIPLKGKVSEILSKFIKAKMYVLTGDLARALGCSGTSDDIPVLVRASMTNDQYTIDWSINAMINIIKRGNKLDLVYAERISNRMVELIYKGSSEQVVYDAFKLLREINIATFNTQAKQFALGPKKHSSDLYDAVGGLTETKVQ